MRDGPAGLRNRYPRRPNLPLVLCAPTTPRPRQFACRTTILLLNDLRKKTGTSRFVLSMQGAHSTAKAQKLGSITRTGKSSCPERRSGRVRQSLAAESQRHVHASCDRCLPFPGVVDDPPRRGVPDVLGGPRKFAENRESSIVLLKNDSAILPLEAFQLVPSP